MSYVTQLSNGRLLCARSAPRVSTVTGKDRHWSCSHRVIGVYFEENLCWQLIFMVWFQILFIVNHANLQVIHLDFQLHIISKTHQ